jgi:anti-sigma regulatory factor (Ser/Thr protein kinase)
LVADISLRIQGTPDAPGDARTAVRVLQHQLPADVLQVVTLLTSELVSNSVKHAAAADVGLAVHLKPHCVRVEISDEGPGFGRPTAAKLPGEYGGWGLYMLAELADRWGVSDDAGAHVWFEVDR